MIPAQTQKNLKHVSWLVAILVLLGILLDAFFAADLFWPAYLSMTFFYGFIFYVAIRSLKPGHTDHMLANRSLPLWLAIFTMSATWIGGGFINGTAEYTYDQGLIWVQAPWGYAASLVIGGLVFARPMRERGFTTLLDPMAQKFGRKLNTLYYLPALMGDLFWTSAILVALGTTFGTIIGLDGASSILLSAFVVILYTSIGGLWSVSMTDVIQLLVLIGGLALVVFVLFQSGPTLGEVWTSYRAKMGPAASLWPDRDYLGSSWALWWDSALLLMLGGIPWQVYFQRVLAAQNAKTAVRLSVIAGVVCLLAAIPVVLIGMKANVTDWAQMGLSPPPEPAFALPHVIRYLTNPWIATLGLGAIAAAVMSSADSSILAASSLTTWNVLPHRFRQTDLHQATTMRRCIWIIGVATTLIALQVKSIYILWFLCSDLVYCLLFPALVTALFDAKANARGAIAGFVVALFLRLGGGEPLLNLPAFLPYPQMDGVITLPFRTIAMLSGLITIILVSRLLPMKKNGSSQR